MYWPKFSSPRLIKLGITEFLNLGVRSESVLKRSSILRTMCIDNSMARLGSLLWGLRHS